MKHPVRPARMRVIAAVASAVAIVAGLADVPLTAASAASAATSARPPTAVRLARADAFPRLASLSPAAAVKSYFLSSGQVPVRAGGRTWELSVEVSSSTLSVPGQVVIQIETPHLGGHEVHDWMFDDFPARDMSVSAGGRATASSGSALSPMASVKLAFTASSHTVESCDSGAQQTTYTGQLTGSVRLATGLHKLTVAATRVTFGMPSTLAIRADSCIPNNCNSFALWGLSSAARFQPPFRQAVGYQTGQPGHLSHYTEVGHLIWLSKAKEIMRQDWAILKTAPPRFSQSRRTLSISTSRNGAVTGSAVIGPAKAIAPETSTCVIGGTYYQETDVGYNGQFVSPAGHHLEGHTLLTGIEQIGRKGTGGFDIITSLKRK